MSGKVTSAPSAGKAEYNFTAIPEELKELHHWVLFKLEGEKTPPDKVPYQLNGQKAKSNDSATWSSFASLVSCCSRSVTFCSV